MLVNLSDVLTSEGKVETVTVPLEMTSFTNRLGSFPIGECSPVEFTFANAGVNKARVTGRADITFNTQCDRCLTEVPTSLTLKFDRIVTSPGVASEKDTSEESDDDLSFMEGYQLDAETFVYNEIMLNWPMKILCRPDCKGVCPVCGRNLNDGECGCDTFVPDPRMAVIKDIFNADKEV